MSMLSTPKSHVPQVLLTPLQSSTPSGPSMKSRNNKNKKLPPSDAPVSPMRSGFSQCPSSAGTLEKLNPIAKHPEPMRYYPQSPAPMFQLEHSNNVSVHVHCHPGHQGLVPLNLPFPPMQVMAHCQSSYTQQEIIAKEKAMLEQELAYLKNVCMQQAMLLSQTSTDASQAQQQQEQQKLQWEQNQNSDDAPYPTST
jgi:hypothetical protein